MEYPGNTSEGRSVAMDDSCPWTDVSASNTQLASLNKQHLDCLREFDRSLVSVGRKIGEGGQGCIYEAKFHLPYSFKSVPVVVKKFKSFVGVSQGHFPPEMFALKMNYLCVPYGVFFEGDCLCIILRRYSCDLRAAIDSHMKALRDEGCGTHRPPFTEDVRRAIILQLAMGMQALHGCGVYHGDLKAANILLRIIGKKYGTSISQPPHLVIADFERSEGVVGTAFFRAPEVLRSLLTNIPLSKEQWLLADIYSFGMVCYEVLTGLIPFECHPLSDYGLVLNGGRPNLPDHVSESMRDLLLRCWHADPHSRPSWIDIIQVLEDDAFEQHDGALGQIDPTLVIENFIKSEMNNLESVEYLSFQSLIYETKQLIRDAVMPRERDSKNFNRKFMPYYWAWEYLATIEEYASKFEFDSFLEGPLVCNVEEVFERRKLLLLLVHHMHGASFEFLTLLDLLLEEWDACALETVIQGERLVGMLVTIGHIVILTAPSLAFTGEFDDETSRIGKLLFLHSLVNWILWHEHVAGEWERQLMLNSLLPPYWSLDTMIQTLFIFLCVIANTYIYVLAMITYEPILLGLLYGLYKAKSCHTIWYRCFREGICRLQRVWMNCTRYKLVSIILSFSFVTLLTMYGWRGILGWILIPCMIIYTPYWRQPILIE